MNSVVEYRSDDNVPLPNPYYMGENYQIIIRNKETGIQKTYVVMRHYVDKNLKNYTLTWELKEQSTNEQEKQLRNNHEYTN